MRRLLALVPLLGCPGTTPDPDPTPDPTPAPFDPSPFELLSYDLDVSTLSEVPTGDGAETVFIASRYRLDTPARIVAVEAMWKVRRETEGGAHLAIWPDLGHNFFDWQRDAPLWEFRGVLDRYESDEQWTLFPLDTPIELDWPQLVYVGQRWHPDDNAPLLMADASSSADPFLAALAPENEQYPPTVQVLPDRGRDDYGFETVSFGGNGPGSPFGDLMVRLYIERKDVVADTWFHEAQAIDGDPRSGLPPAGSVAFADCDGDGDIDVYSGGLYRNDGGVFTAVAAGLVGGAGMWGDYDNDGIVDLFVAGGDDRLYRGLGDCAFEDVTAASGIDDTQPFDTGAGPVEQHAPTPSSAWFDADNDGDLDLYLANFLDFNTGDATVDMLFRNEGDGTFSEVTSASGLNQGGGRAGRGVHPADWDDDGDMDVYVSNYRLHANYAWENRGDGTFADIARGSDLAGHPDGSFPNEVFGHTIGSVWGDLDGDLDLDLFAGTLAHPRFIEWSDKSMLLRNDGGGSFLDVRDGSGLLYQETDSSPVLLDYDLDGDLDLFYTAVYSARPSYLYRNDGDLTFTMVSYPAGTWMWNGWGVAAADLDGDGDVDLYGNKVLRNDYADAGAFIAVEPRGSGDGATNRSGIGVRVRVTTASGTQLREVTSGVGVGNQNPFEQTIGLGAATEAAVVVTFPASGTTVDLGTVAANARYIVWEDGTVETR